MSLFGKGKKDKKFGTHKSLKKKNFSEINDYDDVYDEDGLDEEYYEDEGSAEYEDGEYYEEEESVEYEDEEYYEEEESAEYEDEEYYGEEESAEYEDEEYYKEEESAEYEDGEYYEEEESAEYDSEEYYGEEESAESENREYYKDEESTNYKSEAEEYYNGETPEEYEEEFYYEAGESTEYEAGDEYYGDDINYYEDTQDAQDTEDDEEDDDDLCYVEDGEYEDDGEYDDEDEFVAYRKKKGIAGVMLAYRNLPLIDKVIAITGVAVLIFAVLTGAVFLTVRNENKALAAFAEVGSSLEDVDIIGESGLLAVADAQLAKEAVIEEVEEEIQVVEEESVKGANVSMKTTSIVKDLKIKFINKDTDKLVANVPFEVEITTPSKKTETWTDDDKDGVIYKEDIEAGTYTVKMLELTGYDDYTISTEPQSVEVKANIAYEKVDVAEEIKTESEVNAAVEDTAVAEVVEESKLTDTVPFVQSTEKNNGEVTYQEIEKKDVREPGITASIRTADYYLMTETVSGDSPEKPVEPDEPDKPVVPEVVPKISVTNANISLEVGKTASVGYTQENVVSMKWSSSDTNVATVDAGTVTGVAAGTATITVTGTSENGKTATAACTVTVADTNSVTPDKTSVQVGIKQTVDINVTTVPGDATITADCADKSIATVAVSGKKVTVTGVQVGTTVVTVACSNKKEAKIAVEVVNGYEFDTTSKLKDKDGNQVFVLENNKYREAVYADYYKFDKFYIELKDVLYTGWQNINGKTYYFLENHKYVTGEQVIQGAKYTFASDGSLVTNSGTFGIDVSKWNGSIDWNSVKASGASYAIIRCGYRGSSTGALITDPKFAANISGANAAGMKVGVYFFTQAVNEKEAVEEASMVLDLVRKYKISYPIFLDVESSGGRADGIDKATRTAVCKAFCATIQNSGYTAGVYANKTWLNSKIDTGSLGSYKIWLAQYAAAPTYSGRYNLWQYSSKGSVPGIKGNVDLNLSYLGY